LGVIGIHLLWGVAIGILVKFVLHALNGCPISAFFKPLLDVQELDGKHLPDRGEAINGL
jgi:hypothetical protein